MSRTGHPLSASTPGTMWRTLSEASHAIEPRYLPRLARMLALAVPLATTGVVEQALYARRIAKTPLAAPPLFVLGHWRTGSTHIHNLLAQDPQFGYLSTYDAFTTNNGIVARPLWQKVVRRNTPRQRGFDDMAVEMDLPQEEEHALGNLSHLSYYKSYVFPQLSEQYAQRHLFFDGVPPSEVEAWKQQYDLMLRRITYLAGPRPLVLKSPPNTARLRLLLDLYPQARVVYLYRDPCEVYQSTLRMRARMAQDVGLQHFDHQLASEHLLSMYPRMIQNFFADLPRVQPGRFVAVRYQDLKARPLPTIERIYATLGLPGFAHVVDRFAKYLATVQDFRPARYAPDPQVRRMVEQRWAEVHALHDGLPAD